MVAETGKLYALIENGIVLQIFDKNDIPQWNEQNILCVELSDDDKQWVSTGDKYDMQKLCFVKPTLEEAKEQQLHYVNNRFESEVAKIKAQYTPQDELLTWDLQVSEANAYLNAKNKNAKNAPLLAKIAEQRGIELEALCQKVVEKSNAYREKVFTLIGYRQKLRESIESAESIEAVAGVGYQSPFGFE